ncbi:ABC transporter permease [Chitinophaga arvensicola]|uniref:Putative ABC transport system permease protein n=1 Tax=Chitinophaga arvensicola TaxID=29529 RepID=A0A1I0NWE8_9BACT|nr:ABC transporter permease [Chitinophaga arvensicola]SEW06168.1 putative ABC transport system permease protein [Chitinophaga arvensicola]
MFKRYLVIAFRNLQRQRLFTFINIAGLAVSMTVCLVVLLSVRESFSYDNFHPLASRIWRITTHAQTPDGRKYHVASVPMPMGTALKSNYAAVENEATVYGALSGEGKINDKKINIRGAFATPSFFDVFGFKLAAGNPRMALTTPNSIVLSAETAKRFFGTNDPMGKVIQMDRFGSFIVSGVLQPNPSRSHLDFEAFAAMSSVPALEQSKVLPDQLNNWDIVKSSYTYVVLRKGESVSALTSALTDLGHRYDGFTQKGWGTMAFEAQAFSKISPSWDLFDDIGNTPSWGKVLTEMGVAFGLILCACFNYTNLSIVRALQRAKEVGVRKVNGAHRWQIFMQFITESVLMCLLSLVMAVLLLLTMQASHFSGLPVPDINLLTPAILGWFLLFSVIIGLIAGAIPAWALSAFQPAKVLKNMIDIKLFGGIGLRKTLIVIQFSLSITAIIFLVTVYRQFHYKSVKDMGFARRDILNVPLEGVDYQRMKERMLQLKEVESATASSGTLGMPRHSSFCNLRTGDSKNTIEFGYYAGDMDFLNVMHLKLLAGTTFPAAASREKEQYLVVNEKALSIMGVKSPADAIGKTLFLSDSLPLSIVGVVKDFNYQPIEVNIRPMAIRFIPGEFHQLQLTMNNGDKTAQLADVKKIWLELHPGETFNAEWMDEQLLSRDGREVVSMLGFLVFITTMIAALGLLGIVAYTSFTRKKEISIRKVLGATAPGLLILLSKNYVRLILIAGCIALPLGYIGSTFFLQIFAYRVSIGILPMLGSFFLLLMLALITILSQTWRAIDVNPADNLRND